jgi:hypothetical protein
MCRKQDTAKFIRQFYGAVTQMTFSKKSNLLNQLDKNRFKKSKIKFIKNPKGKIVHVPFILNPNYQEIYLIKAQIKWCDETAIYYLRENFDYHLFSRYVVKAEKLRNNLKKLAR